MINAMSPFFVIVKKSFPGFNSSVAAYDIIVPAMRPE